MARTRTITVVGRKAGRMWRQVKLGLLIDKVKRLASPALKAHVDKVSKEQGHTLKLSAMTLHDLYFWDRVLDEWEARQK